MDLCIVLVAAAIAGVISVPTVYADAPAQAESSTVSHDAAATRYVYMCLAPILIGSFIYSWMYLPLATDKSTGRAIYSWTLSSIVRAVYVFGFLMMTPQLYLNYKVMCLAQGHAGCAALVTDRLIRDSERSSNQSLTCRGRCYSTPPSTPSSTTSSPS